MRRTNVRSRFPNSIHACNGDSGCSGVGVKDPGVHSGQVEHPRPEPVNRTEAPVMTIAD